MQGPVAAAHDDPVDLVPPPADLIRHPIGLGHILHDEPESALFQPGDDLRTPLAPAAGAGIEQEEGA